ncbi:MAG: elongation factor 1-beta [Halobacteriales archaeon]
MGKVAAQLKVMPENADTDLEELEESLVTALPEGAELNGSDTQDVAFGLVALVVAVVVPDDEGGTEAVEEAFADTDGVESVSVENVGRV